MIETILITGYLGSGKTTLVNALLSHCAEAGWRASLLLNDFGDVNVDTALIGDEVASKYDVHSGSIFCSCTATQLQTALGEIVADAPDVLLVEASGMAAPATFNALLASEAMRDAFALRGNIVVVDAGNFTAVAPFFQVARQQVSAGDLLLVNKTDLATERELKHLCNVLHELNPDAPIATAEQSQLSPDALDALSPLGRMNLPPADAPPASLAAVTIQTDAPLSRTAFDEVIDELGESLLRLKGNVTFDTGRAFVSLAGGQLQTAPPAKLTGQAATCFVAITYRLPARDVRELFNSCVRV